MTYTCKLHKRLRPSKCLQCALAASLRAEDARKKDQGLVHGFMLRTGVIEREQRLK